MATQTRSASEAAAGNIRCSHGICDPERTQGLRAPAPEGTHELVMLQGPGVFVAAELSKQGGGNDITFVILDIDGRGVTNISFAAATNLGLMQHNPYGLVLFHPSSGLKTMTIGFQHRSCTNGACGWR